ncbi:MULTISPECIES: hypothetical protein [Pseudanabaena]|uniref:Sporulation domain-containing protein n=2 Tax=Pseudanabaena TaxID=1152 RepID=L8N4E9_9CYAN|nr:MULTISPECIES: hypothetical protein [Pseudanabaena]ELS34546.1 hypothetical protein Pse7429DRAFT_0212 [Pseudanabaena biceps PCC 7429]MDG3493231.1 hypothetical protein [Pseudanabaena catenata USMAC16]
MKSLGISTKGSWTGAICIVSTFCLAGFTFSDNFGGSTAIAQPIGTQTCPQLTNRRYVVILDRAANQLPQLPEFLAIAAAPCSYLNTSMTFFGGFDNAQSSTFRANQLRELGLDAVIHSFSAKVNDVPANLQAAVILVEMSKDPNLEMQQVQSLSGKSTLLATFNNRSVILAAPLSSQQSANAIAAKLRGQGLGAQVIGASLIASPTASTNTNTNTTANSTGSLPTNSVPISNQSKPTTGTGTTIYRVLVPNANANTLAQVRELAPDAFVTIFKGKSYIQVRTYSNRSNAHRERDRLNARFVGTILLQD